ncbi:MULTISPECIES: lysophospholipid acyltransferase family protein [unclassified Lentilitoribacter]|jgi:1-acyl-sn-glycerol-3-phosphate acyltransferase|uniref:lysophospholipid acyltransferase family protein n=1 Tax=unclassified Lentilitoribacter TaxID=2647570 RepID=UPI0013A6E0F9|nr:lysophospholipid acyltransferase family protein [Lentilitoribacter sp. Alg239-R112]
MYTFLRAAKIILILSLLTFTLLPFYLLALLFRDDISRYFPTIWHKVACWSLGIKINQRGSVSKKQPLMIAANHSSWIDIIALGSCFPLVFIAKSDVKTWPIFGFLAKLQRTIFIERTRRSKTKEQVGEISTRMKHGDIVVLFPEGTTSDGNYVLPFKSALFGAVQQAQTDLVDHELFIQPVSIAYLTSHGIPLNRSNRSLASWPGDVELLPHLKNIILEGSMGIEITYADPIKYTEDMSRSEIAKQCETAVRSCLNASLRQ